MEGSKVPASRGKSLQTHDCQLREMMGVGVGCKGGAIMTEVVAKALKWGRREWHVLKRK